MSTVRINPDSLGSSDAFGEWWNKQSEGTCRSIIGAANNGKSKGEQLDKDIANCCWESLTGDEQETLYQAACKMNDVQPA